MEFLHNIIESYMEMPPIVMLMIAQDDEDELTMYETYLFNTFRSEINRGTPKGLPGWHPPVPGYRPSDVIENDIPMYLEEINTSVLEPNTHGKI